MQGITRVLLALSLILVEVWGSSGRSNSQRIIQNPIKTDSKSSEERIIGGSEAARGEFPWIVLIQIDNIPFCAGSIVNSEWIVTSPLCAVRAGDVVSGSAVVVAGEHNRNVNEGSEQVRSVSEIIFHPGNNNFQNSVAVIKLSSPLVLDQYVAAAEIPEVDFIPEENLVVAGWGTTTSCSFDFVLTLRKVTVTLASQSTCKAQWSSEVDEGNICAGGNGFDFNGGDLGGPLHSGRSLVGISLATACGTGTEPGLYANVPYLSSWIRSITDIPTPTTTTTPTTPPTSPSTSTPTTIPTTTSTTA